jgi:flagellar basal body-associated protein FliL
VFEHRNGDKRMLKILTIAAVIGAFAFALSFVGLSAWRSFHDQKHQTNQEASIKEATENSGQSPSHVVTKETPEQAIARYNLWLMIFTGVLAFVALIQIAFLLNADKTTAKAANAAQDSAAIARQTLIASNRPWISISTPVPEGQLMWEEKGARITVNLTIKNIGKNPAFDIATEADQFVMGPDNFDIGAAVTKHCAEVRQRQIARAANGHHGEVLFPDETLPQKFGLLFSREQIDAAAKNMGRPFFSAVVVICVDYRSPITKQSHQTGLAYMLVKPPTEPGGLTRLPTPDETLNYNQFGLARSPFGSFAN